MTPRIIHSEEDVEMINQLETARMSWCLADVVNINGVANLSSGNGFWGPPCSAVIYPDVTPCIDVVDGQIVPGTEPGGIIQFDPNAPISSEEAIESTTAPAVPVAPVTPAVDPALLPQAQYPSSQGANAQNGIQQANYYYPQQQR